jgi:hypothetical protein
MCSKAHRILYAFLFSSIIAPGTLWAMDVVMLKTCVGGVICPSSYHESIRMDSLHVAIRLKKESYSVDAVCRLFNTGKTLKERIGVPKFLNFDRPFMFDFITFDVWVDGIKTSVKEVSEFLNVRDRGVDYLCRPYSNRMCKWMVTQATFPGHASTTIRVRHEAFYEKGKKARYIFWTGRYWMGRIGMSTVVKDYTDVGGVTNKVVSPRASVRVITDNFGMYEQLNVEPDHGRVLNFGYRPPAR